MVQNFHMPPIGFGPGSQTADAEETLEYMALPQDMRTYSPHLPEVEDAASVAPAIALLRRIAGACARAARTGATAEFDLAGLDAENRALIADTMGEGEVSVKIHGIPAVAAQESVFAGVWRLSGAGIDRIEVAPIPSLALDRAFTVRRAGQGATAPRPEGVVNAPALLAELLDKSVGYGPDAPLHVVNLTLLPHTEPDLLWLDSALGEGSVTILSRGYGNCRITATGTAHVWRVQFFNSMDTLILDTFEVTAMPEVAIAAAEDLADSAARITEVLEAME